MSQYLLSLGIKDCLEVEDSHIYEDLRSLLCSRNGLDIAANSLNIRSQNMFSAVLRTICEATLAWKKPFELMRPDDFKEGKADWNFVCPGICRATFYRAIKVLIDNHFVRKLTARNGQDVYYALNLPVIISKIGKYYESHQGHSYAYDETVRLYSSIKESEDYSKLVAFIEECAEKVVSDAQKFLSALREKFGSVIEGAAKKTMSLASKISQAIEKAEEVHMEKVMQKADEPFFGKSDKPNAKAALAYWYREVRDSEEFRGFNPTYDGKTLGMMKNWLRELYQDGKDEQTIRNLIHSYIVRWKQVPANRRSFQATSQKGKPYTATMPMTPQFDTFYAYRRQLSTILETTNDRLNLDYDAEGNKRAESFI